MPRREFEIIWDLGTCKVEDLSSYATTLGPVGILLRLPGKEHPQIVCALYVDLVFGSSLKPGFCSCCQVLHPGRAQHPSSPLPALAPIRVGEFCTPAWLSQLPPQFLRKPVGVAVSQRGSHKSTERAPRSGSLVPTGAVGQPGLAQPCLDSPGEVLRRAEQAPPPPPSAHFCGVSGRGLIKV